MAIVKSGFGSNVLTIDSTSKAARVTDFSNNGNACESIVKVGSYMAGINVRCASSVSSASAVFVWAFLNKSPYNARIRSIRLTSAFDGTAATTDYVPCLSFCKLEQIQFTNGTVTVPGRKSSRFPHSSVELRTLTTGLTMGTGFAPALSEIFNVDVRQGTTGTVSTQSFYNSLDKYWDKMVVPPNTGIGAYFLPVTYRSDAPATYSAGIGIYGYIEWDEVAL